MHLDMFGCIPIVARIFITWISFCYLFVYLNEINWFKMCPFQSQLLSGWEITKTAVDTGTMLLGGLAPVVIIIWSAAPGSEALSGNLAGSVAVAHRVAQSGSVSHSNTTCWLDCFAKVFIAFTLSLHMVPWILIHQVWVMDKTFV